MKFVTRVAKRSARRGLSALELTISTAVLLLTARLTVTAIAGLQRVSSQSSASTRLQEEAERAMVRVVGMLQRSGFATVAGKSYPYIFEDGQPNQLFDLHQHAAPVIFPIHQNGMIFVPATANREIVFLQPIDADAPGQAGHGVPDTDANGALAWDPVEHSFVVVAVADDANELQYRRDADQPETLAVGVESFVCLDSTASGSLAPPNAIQVELTVRGRDEAGRTLRYTSRAIVRLRNG